MSHTARMLSGDGGARVWVEQQMDSSQDMTWVDLANWLSNGPAHIDELAKYTAKSAPDLASFYLWHMEQAGMVGSPEPEIWQLTEEV